MKKILSVFLSIVMLLSITVGIDLSAYAETYDDLVYEVLDKDTVKITGYNGSPTDISIPSKIGGYTVTSIGDYAFEWCDSLTSVTIPNSVTEIGSGAFGSCESLTSVTIPNSVTSIGDSTFAFCIGLKSVTIPNSVTSIGENAFENCTSLSAISVSTNNSNYSSVDGVLFNKNKTILIQYPAGSARTVYNIPSSVTTVKNRSFGYCSNLTSVTIPNSVTTIEPYAFTYCSGLKSVTIPNSITSIGISVFEYCISLKNVTIPNSVTSIGDYAFAHCEGLTSVTIPNSVTSIGSWAYNECSSLANVTIPVSVTSIGWGAFHACKSLKNISVDYNNPNYSSVDGVLFNKDKTSLIQYPTGDTRTSYVVPNSVKTIVEYAFDFCTNLISLTIPKSVESVGSLRYVNNVIYNGELDTSEWEVKAVNGFVDGYFVYKDSTKTDLLGCSSQVTAATIPNSVITIGANAFAYCSGLTSITIPDSVTSLGDYAFYLCNSLTSVAIGSGLSSIGFGAFSDCKSLSTISVSNNNSNYSSLDGVLFNKDKTELILYPMGNSRTAYNIPSGVTTILEESFSNCEKLRSVTIPKSVKRIGFFAFGIHKTLTDVYYTGSEKDWLGIQIDGHNDNLINANIHYNSIPPCTNHTPASAKKENVKNATCTAAGSYDSVVYCSVCKAEISRTKKTIAKLGHNYKTTTTKATQTADGKIVKKCSKCNYVASTTVIPKASSITISTTKYTYDSNYKKPTVTVKDRKGNKLSTANYSVTYSNNKYVGKASVKVTLKGNYTGTKTLYFTINPKGTTLSTLTATSKGFKVTWKKQATQTTGYQIQYATNSRFDNAKLYTISKNTTTSKTISKLTAKKKYYVRVRTYKTVNGTKYYSGWSGYKYVTTKS